MAEDSFIREVNEEIRQEKLGFFWRRYGFALVGAAIAIVLVTAAYQGYAAWTSRKADRMGDAFVETLELADKADSDAVLKKLDAVEKTGFGAYPALAAIRKASLLMERGDRAGAIAIFDAVAAAYSTPKILKDMASLRAAYILVDTGSFADVEKRVKALATDIDPMRLAARETLGLAAWKAGKTEDALYYFNKIRDDKDAAATGFSRRAAMMLSLIDSRNPQTEG